MRPVGPILTYVGVVFVAAGFGIMLFTWGEVAGLASVALQMPYLVSGGLVGVGVILTGLTILVLNAKTQDVATRDRELVQLQQTLAEIKVLLDAPDHGGTSDDPEADPQAAIEPAAESLR